MVRRKSAEENLVKRGNRKEKNLLKGHFIQNRSRISNDCLQLMTQGDMPLKPEVTRDSINEET